MSPVVVGNVYDKYGTKNPIARWLMRGFLDAVSELYLAVRPERVLEVGCGEGHLAQHLISLSHQPKVFQACDFSLKHLAPHLDSRLIFSEADIYKLPFGDRSFDLVVCCEVLEHLEFPNLGLAEICRVSEGALLISTPREPLWRLLNLLRGKYWQRLGNTPGHVQHFSQSGLLRWLGSTVEVGEIRTPLPWTVIIGQLRSGSKKPGL
jgi:ubiquinone/menaquinone biosynthesis C-methylase UbiE